MKKFVEILEDIRKVGADIKAAEQHESSLNSAFRESIHNKTVTKEQAEEHKKAIAANTEKLTDLTLTLRIMQNNAKIAIFNEIAPVVVEVFNKYMGKPYGEKTKQKIADEIAEKTHFRCYVHSNYSSQTIDATSTDFYNYNYNISIGGRNDLEAFLLDNKIQKITLEELQLWYTEEEYIEHIQERILDLKAAYAQVLRAREELENACEKFNALTVGDIHRVQVTDPYYRNIAY